MAADVRNATGANGSYGLMFGMSDDWTQVYTFEIYPNGTYEIWRGGFGATWTMLASGSSGSINTGTASNRLKVERNSSLIEVYANGQLLRSISDSSYTGLTQAGVIVSFFGSDVDARFDDFTIYSATCDATTVTALGESTGSSDSDGRTKETDPDGGWAEGSNRKGE